MYSKCKRMVGLLLICVLALGVSAAAFETQIEPRDNWHDYTGELPADTGDVEVSTVKKAYTNNYFAVSCKSLAVPRLAWCLPDRIGYLI